MGNVGRILSHIERGHPSATERLPPLVHDKVRELDAASDILNTLYEPHLLIVSADYLDTG